MKKMVLKLITKLGEELIEISRLKNQEWRNYLESKG